MHRRPLFAVALGVISALSALCLLTAAVLGALLRRTPTERVLARALALLGGALALVRGFPDPASWPFVSFAVTGAFFEGRPLALMGAAAAAVAVGFPSGLGVPAPGYARSLAGAASALAAGAWSSSLLESLAAGVDPAWVGGSLGLLSAAILAGVGRGSLLHFRLDLGGLALPGPAVLLALTILTALLGAMLLFSHLLSRTEAPGPRTLGERALVLGATFGILAVSLLLFEGSSGRPDALAQDTVKLFAILASVGSLVVGTLLSLSDSRPASFALPSDLEAPASLVLALVSVFVAGVEGVLREGSYLTRTSTALMAAALVGFAFRGRAVGAARGLFVVALLCAALAEGRP